jgi:hypothetical protein
MTTQSMSTDPGPTPHEPGTRVIPVGAREVADPAEPWELPATPDDLVELSTKRFERLPHRPASLADVPDAALTGLRRVVGDVQLEHVFVIPRAARTVGVDWARWVVAPTEVVAIGEDRMAVWIDDLAGPRVRAVIPFRDVLAILDRSILLYGRLEIIGPEASIVVRYNTVGQPELRALLLPIRRSRAPVPGTLATAAGHDPGALPHKWMALLHSSEVRTGGREPMLVAAGNLDDPKPQLHNGVAVLTSAELIVATDPTPDIHSAQYGVDLLVVPRSLVTALGGGGATLAVTVRAAPGPVEVRVAAHPSLVAEALRVLAPVVAAGG